MMLCCTRAAPRQPSMRSRFHHCDSPFTISDKYTVTFRKHNGSHDKMSYGALVLFQSPHKTRCVDWSRFMCCPPTPIQTCHTHAAIQGLLPRTTQHPQYLELKLQIKLNVLLASPMAKESHRGENCVWEVGFQRHLSMSNQCSLALILSALVLGLMVSKDFGDQFSTFPPSVGRMLKRAYYYTHVNWDPAQALKAYHQTLQLAAREGMDPLSGEVLGIRNEFARFLEMNGDLAAAIDILERAKRTCLERIEELGDGDDVYKERRRLLEWAVRSGTRLGDLYGSPYVRNHKKMEESLVWSVEQSLRELQRREKEGVKEGEGDWLTPDDQGSQLEGETLHKTCSAIINLDSTWALLRRKR